MKKLIQHFNKICLFSYVSGIALFVFFNHEDQSEHCYFSENALLPGLVQLEHFPSEKQINSYSKNCFSDQNNRTYDSLKTLFQSFGIEVYEQKFQFQSNFVTPEKELQNGTNIYAVIRAMRSASTEAIVINVPMNPDVINYASGVSTVFAEIARDEIFWAKDIVVLFSEHGTYGVRAWLDEYHGMPSSHITSSQLPARAGSIQAAITLELPKSTISSINLKIEGRDGQLPNLDLVNLVVRLTRLGNIRVSINQHFPPFGKSQFTNLKEYLSSSVSMMKQLAIGKTSGNHGEFLIYNIPALTIQGVHRRHSTSARLVSIERLLNGICRSLNNLLERFHQSFFFYFLPSVERYISIAMYMPCLGLVLLPAVLKALALITKRKLFLTEDAEADSSSKYNDNEELEKILKESNSSFAQSSSASGDDGPSVWYETLIIVVGAYLTGFMLFYSSHFTTTWSEMFHIPHDICFVLLHLFVCLSGLLFVSSTNISKDATSILHIVTLLQMSITLGTLSITNFSLGFISSIVMVPLSLIIQSNSKRFSLLYKFILLIASPPVGCLILFPSIKEFIEIYNWYVTNQSMLYLVLTLLFFPIWLQFWGITASFQSAQTSNEKEKND